MQQQRILSIFFVLLVLSAVRVVEARRTNIRVLRQRKQKSRTRGRSTHQQHGKRILALPLDWELDDDTWEEGYRAPPKKASKTASTSSSTKSPQAVETKEPKAPSTEPEDLSGDGDQDSQDASELLPSEQPSSSPTTFPTPTFEESSSPTAFESAQAINEIHAAANEQEQTSKASSSGMTIGLAVSGMGLVFVILFFVKRKREGKRILRTAQEVEKGDLVIEDGVIEEDEGAAINGVCKPRENFNLNEFMDRGKIMCRTMQEVEKGDLVIEDGVIEEDEGGTFTGVYKLRKNNNLNEFMEAIGISWAVRSATARARPIHYITHEGDTITMKIKGMPRATYIIDGPAVENVLVSRIFSCTARYTEENDGFEVFQEGVDEGDYNIRLRWSLADDSEKVQMSLTALFLDQERNPVVCTQIYQRIGEF